MHTGGNVQRRLENRRSLERGKSSSQAVAHLKTRGNVPPDISLWKQDGVKQSGSTWPWGCWSPHKTTAACLGSQATSQPNPGSSTACWSPPTRAACTVSRPSPSAATSSSTGAAASTTSFREQQVRIQGACFKSSQVHSGII